MFRKYLLKRRFWAVPRNDTDKPCYIYHDEQMGGIYAYLVNKGIIIKTNTESHFFTSFTELDMFFDRTITNNPQNTLYHEMREAFLNKNLPKNYEQLPF